MAQQREATTDRLVSIIASIKMERKSGQLRARRGEGRTSEEGVLTFAHGQVTRANVGRRNGADALNWLSTWGQARYIFLSATSGEEIPMEWPALLSSSAGGAEVDTGALFASIHTDKLEPEQAAESGYEAPYPSMELREATARIEQAGLSRAHRRLYLLIDGHRSVHELVPLLGKRAEEVRSMLHDLEWLGIVRANDLPT